MTFCQLFNVQTWGVTHDVFVCQCVSNPVHRVPAIIMTKSPKSLALHSGFIRPTPEGIKSFSWTSTVHDESFCIILQ